MPELIAKLDTLVSDICDLEKRISDFRDSLSEDIDGLKIDETAAIELEMSNAVVYIKMRINSYEKIVDNLNLYLNELERERISVIAKGIELTEPSLIPKYEDKCKIFRQELSRIQVDMHNAESKH